MTSTFNYCEICNSIIVNATVKFLFRRNWFTCINWLELKLQLNVFIIQTNRCFIKSKIRDLLCIRRFFIEIFNDYRISLIINLFVIFIIHEIKIYEIFLITSFDAYIEICLLKFEHQCRTIVFSFLIWIVASRSFDFDLNCYTIFFQRDRNFMKFTCLTSKSTFTSSWKSSFSNIIRLMTFSRNLFSKIVSRWRIMRKKLWKEKIWKCFI